ncbi:RNA polymerase III RPC4-domain-containing protein [Tirmania nivea]|nr:RNA polymerase III RPC4-domain-containing protein [Tirmania nivea]
MPPKLHVKPKAPVGGRRGGRGGAAASAVGPTPAPIEGTTAAAGESSEASSTAAATNTPSAATTRSIAPPAGRLDSLKLTPAGGSASGTQTPSTPGLGAGGGRGGLRGKAPLRFKPKAVVRKTAEERAKLEATVAAPSSIPNPSTDPTRAPSSTTAQGGFSSRGGGFRGRGRGGRGRGRGRGGADAASYQAVTSTASGPFALGSITSGRSKVIHERGVELRTTTSRSKKSRGITIDDGGVRVKSERDDPDYYLETEDESDGGPKVNIERIEDLVDSGDEEGEDSGGVGVKGEKMPLLYPLRVERYRHEEKERAIPIFKDQETAGKKGKGVGGGRKVKLEGGEEDVKVKVKAEPVDDGDMAIVDSSPIVLDASGTPQPPMSTSRPSSPELSKKIPLKPSQSPEARRKSRGKSTGAGRRRTQSHILSPEEEMEIKMEEEDRLATLRELGMGAPRVVGGEDGEVQDEGAAGGDLEGIKNGDLFFFQFPTVVPPLERIEPVGAGLSVDGVVGGSAAVDVDAQVNPDQKKTGVGKKKAPLDSRAMERQVLPQGVVGQLRVHRSGRVSILWGNPEPTPPSSPPSSHNQSNPHPQLAPTSAPVSAAQPIEMTVTRGAQCEFLQDIVVMNPTPKRTEGPSSAEGTPTGKEEEESGVLGVVNRGVIDPKTGKMVGAVWSLGQVRGKFVVSPDFGRLLGGGGVGR